MKIKCTLVASGHSFSFSTSPATMTERTIVSRFTKYNCTDMATHYRQTGQTSVNKNNLHLVYIIRLAEHATSAT